MKVTSEETRYNLIGESGQATFMVVTAFSSGRVMFYTDDGFIKSEELYENIDIARYYFNEKMEKVVEVKIESGKDIFTVASDL